MNRMNNRTPRLATLALMLAALTACTKTTISPNDDLTNALNPTSGAPIAFESQDAFTKADDNTDPEAFMAVRAGGFKVWSWFQGTTAGPIFGENGTFVWDNNYVAELPEDMIMPPVDWKYEDTRYWINGIYHFAAVYPSTLTGVVYQAVPPESAPILTIPAFNVENNDDLLVAFNTGENGKGINGLTPPDYVGLSFSHKLTKVNFKIKQDELNDPNNNYYITRVVLSGVKNKMTYTATPIADTDGNISLTETWTPSGNTEALETISIEKSFESVPLKDELGQYVQLSVWEDDPLLLIPQEVDGETMKITVYYTYDMDGPIDGNGTADMSSEAVIPAIQWQSGMRITYIVPVDEDFDISIGAPTIEPWTYPQPGGTVIIK